MSPYCSLSFREAIKSNYNFSQLVEKLRCILSLPNLFPSLARRFACCQSCFVSLRTLWAYGFDSAARRALEKSKVGEKEKYFISFQPTLPFKKQNCGVPSRLAKATLKGLGLDGLTEQSAKL